MRKGDKKVKQGPYGDKDGWQQIYEDLEANNKMDKQLRIVACDVQYIFCMFVCRGHVA
jgi:hypothetical protein